MPGLDRTLPVPSEGDAGSPPRRQLYVLGPGAAQSIPLPPSGSLTIGRGDGVHVRLDDPASSRRHATLHIGSELALEDHGSANGTRVGAERVPAHVRAPLAVGVPVHIGETILLVQAYRSAGVLRRVWPHVAFVSRVEDEVRRGAAFAVVHARGGDPAVWVAAIEPLLTAADVVGRYGPHAYELLLTGRSPAALEDTLAQLQMFLQEAGLPADVGVATFPTDASSAEALLGLAGERLDPTPPGAAPVFEAPAMQVLYQLAARVARSDLSVLIEGETGAGKDVLARYLHARSERAERAFLSLNCAALNETLLESELFGHEKGAFTGAAQAKAGLLESAPGGTVFLDEIGELPLSVQAKLLRVLETRELLRLGATRPRTIDARFIAATNRDLAAEVERGVFRRDLYFRLNGITLTVPPLRERRDEIAPLARNFLAQAARRQKRPAPALTEAALGALQAYAYPGNVRELRNVIERALVLCDGEALQPVHLGLDGGAVVRVVESTGELPGAGLRETITGALSAAGGNQTRAAQALGISRRTLLRRLDELGLPRPLKVAGNP